MKLEVHDRLGGTFKDCWEIRQQVIDGKFVALCDDTTIMKVMAWDFRLVLEEETSLTDNM